MCGNPLCWDCSVRQASLGRKPYTLRALSGWSEGWEAWVSREGRNGVWLEEGTQGVPPQPPQSGVMGSLPQPLWVGSHSQYA
jgi:hypothetical protein